MSTLTLTDSDFLQGRTQGAEAATIEGTLINLLMTVPSVAILFIHMRPIGYMASVATKPAAFGTEIVGTQVQLVAASGAALLVLLVATTLSVYKPRGLTRYGARKLDEQRAS